MASIRTNLQAGLISRQLSNINRRFTTNLERLSTGLRLNRPDDSPGQYGVVINQNLQIQSLNQGVVNAQNAAGMLQTAEEGINTIIDVLNRAHDLAVTAADATLTQSQRQQAQDEVERLLTASDGSGEIQQILDNVNYNGVKLLADSEKSASIQSGAIGAVGGNREATAMGGDKVSVEALIDANVTTGSTLFNDLTAGILSTTFDAVGDAKLSSVLTTTTKSGMVVNMASTASTVIEKGDILELKVTSSAGTVTDQVIVASIDNSATATTDDVTIFNAQGHNKSLNLYQTLVTDKLTSATSSTTFSINRIPQTLILDSTGATSISENYRDFNPGTIATTGNNNSEFREVMHVGVALQASGDSTPAALSRVTVSFADTNPLSAAQKIESAIEEQLGGEYRDGGALHIDVTAVADVYKLSANIDSGTAASSMQIAANAEITQEVWDSTVAMINGGDYTDFAGGLTEQIGTEYAAINKVYFKFSTTTTAGVSQTPELRIMSDELAGYTDTTKYPSRLFGNTLSIATGEHGNDKFMLTIDGEEVEVDLDGDFASSTAQRIDTLVDEVEKQTVDAASSTGAVNAEITRMGITNERTHYYTAVNSSHTTGSHWGISQEIAGHTTAGLYTGNLKSGAAFIGTVAADFTAGTALALTAGSNFASGTASYDLGTATSRNYTGGYYSQDNLRTMLTDAINTATKSAADASVSYDHSTRTFSITTGSRSNLSSLSIGKGVGTNITLDGVGSATNLIDTTPGTAGFVGVLGLAQDSSSQGSGSDFQFRLGGGDDTYSIDFGTFGITNMGADQVDISNITLATQSGASSAITVIETALDSISTTQTRIGAGINHMSRRVNVMESHREALRGAKARIEEIDFTVETRNLASLQILLQSSTAALAQANIIPQTLLQLLA